MRRLVLPAVLGVALSLALAGPVAAKTKSYAGIVEGGGTVDFKAKKKHGKKSVKDFTFREVPIDCAGGPNTASGHVTFKMKLQQKQFSGSAESDSGGKLKVEGTVRKSNSNGTIRVFGSVPLDDETTGSECDSGTVAWTADRV